MFEHNEVFKVEEYMGKKEKTAEEKELWKIRDLIGIMESQIKFLRHVIWVSILSYSISLVMLIFMILTVVLMEG